MNRIVPSAKRISLNGMSIIELLAAIMLSSMLLVALVGVQKNLILQHKTIEEVYRDQDWQQRLNERLEWDMNHSYQIRIDESAIYFWGFSSRDFNDGVPNGLASRVTYRIRDLAGQKVLIRDEVHPQVLNNQNRIKELMAVSIVGFQIDRLDDSPEKATLIPITQQKLLIPDRLRVLLYFKNSLTVEGLRILAK